MEKIDKELLAAAKAAMDYSYSPYSSFAVGAAIRTLSGKIFSACNIENASYPAGLCAERAAAAKAVSEGEYAFEAIAITARRLDQPVDRSKQLAAGVLSLAKAKRELTCTGHGSCGENRPGFTHCDGQGPCHCEGQAPGLELEQEKEFFAGRGEYRVVDPVGLDYVDQQAFPFPCGICRQFLHEFGPNMQVYVLAENDDLIVTSLTNLLPHAFGPDNL